MTDDKGIKVILIGETGVGKTNLIRAVLGKEFDASSESSLTSSFYEEFVLVNGKNYSYNLWDTAGQEVYRSMNKIFIKNAKIVLVVFAIDSKNTFEQVDFWYNYAKEILGEDGYTIALVGNKNDLYEKQEIPDEEINKKAEELKVKLKITSSKEDRVGFKEFLEELLTEYIKQNFKEDAKNENNNKTNDNQQETFKIDNEKGKNNGKNKQKKNCC